MKQKEQKKRDLVDPNCCGKAQHDIFRDYIHTHTLAAFYIFCPLPLDGGAFLT